MPSISQTIARLSAGTIHPVGGAGGDRLTALTGWSPDPGALQARCYVPDRLAEPAALVVALHGCTQTATGYDHGTGWSALAERQGFAVLLPEQVQANNANRCFNWFVPGDIRRGGGEAESIAAMVRTILARHPIDPARVFVTGLSAGGAMTAVMLATYPDLFAGGAIIGGLPYGCATSVGAALAQMSGGGADATLLTAVAAASTGQVARVPSVSLWHGTADPTVNIANLDRLGQQWRHVHGIDGLPAVTTGQGWERRAWPGPDGRHLVEEWRIAGMGHGVPIDPTGPSALGAHGPYMLDVGLSSTLEIARGWGLVTKSEAAAVAKPVRSPVAAAPATKAAAPAAPNAIQHTIEQALRSAGLMR